MSPADSATVSTPTIGLHCQWHWPPSLICRGQENEVANSSYSWLS